MRERPSLYYPPRARWFSGFLRMPSQLRQACRLDKFQDLSGLSLSQWLGGLVIPGFGFSTAGLRLLGWLGLGVYALAALIYFIRLGHPLAGLLSGGMIGLHTTSAVFMLNRQVPNLTFPRRLFMTFGTLFILWSLVYCSLFRYCERFFFLPLRIQNSVIVINCRDNKPPLARDEYFAYRFDSMYAPGYRINAGYGLDRVLALPGEQIRFRADHYEINGVIYQRLAGMPSNEEWTVPTNHCFVWPTLIHMQEPANAQLSVVAKFRQQASLVPQDHWMGRPFEHWFFRRQVLP